MSKTISVSLDPRELADTFLAQAAHFQLGHLPTESRHPRTTRLSLLAQRDDLSEAIDLLKDVELEALKGLDAKKTSIEELCSEIRATLNAGGNIYLCGCGATGRLSLSLETLWREECERRGKSIAFGERVISFMAGGDYAMVRSIENFEDHPEYGAKQLHDLKFTDNDLLIGCTEGGETPFVIGAVEEAARISKRKAYLLFCNPSDLLANTVERSRIAIENPRIISIAIETGPMALAGSTRLQATTVLMLGTGAALFTALEDGANSPQAMIEEFKTSLRAADLSKLAPLIIAEAEIYKKKGLCLHRTSSHAITVLTDTTERSPTFSLFPFEDVFDSHAPLSWTYLIHSEAKDGDHAWRKILGRAPRPLNWPDFREKFGAASLRGFDFSPLSIARRKQKVRSIHVFDIVGERNTIKLRLDEIEATIPRAPNLLCEHLVLKIALNVSSTLTMGRLDRFSGNLMLYVRAANNKLVDRAIRYVRILLDDEGIRDYSYGDVCLALFETTPLIAPDEPAVWRTFENLRDKKRSPGLGPGSDND